MAEWAKVREQMIDRRFGRITVLAFSHCKNYVTYYLCSCDCGNTAVLSGNKLKMGYTKSCGCWRKECYSTPHLNGRYGPYNPQNCQWITKSENARKQDHKKSSARRMR